MGLLAKAHPRAKWWISRLHKTTSRRFKWPKNDRIRDLRSSSPQDERNFLRVPENSSGKNVLCLMEILPVTDRVYSRTFQGPQLPYIVGCCGVGIKLPYFERLTHEVLRDTERPVT